MVEQHNYPDLYLLKKWMKSVVLKLFATCCVLCFKVKCSACAVHDLPVFLKTRSGLVHIKLHHYLCFEFGNTVCTSHSLFLCLHNFQPWPDDYSISLFVMRSFCIPVVIATFSSPSSFLNKQFKKNHIVEPLVFDWQKRTRTKKSCIHESGYHDCVVCFWLAKKNQLIRIISTLIRIKLHCMFLIC